MPVSLLLVEGALDAEVLGAILAGTCAVQIGGAKGSLRHRAKQMRDDHKGEVCYIRDRDFDFEPPVDVSRPADDDPHFGLQLGWYWCRHEIENYLIEPALVSQAVGWDEREFASELIVAARRIRDYQIARWVIGTARRSLPPQYELTTRPNEFADRDFLLPDDMSAAAVQAWVKTHIGCFHERVTDALRPEAIEASLARRAHDLADANLDQTTGVLKWCSGKDLLAALSPRLKTKHETEPGILRRRARDWVQKFPDRALELLPEWSAFRARLAT
jgi:hypothetical protein